MLKPVLQAGLAGLSAASASFDRAAAQVTREAALSSSGDAATVSISAAARGSAASGAGDSGGLEGALVDTRMAKYAFIANLRVLQTGDEMADSLLSIKK